MKHIASLRDGDIVKYALVDEETGELVQFAQLQVPDHFDFAASALLGTNLADVLGLNGRQRPSGRAKEVAHAFVEQVVKPQLDVAAPTTKRGRPRKDGTPNQAHTKQLIPMEWVIEVINEYPDGIGTHDVADRIWRTKLGQDGKVERWAVKAVENRVQARLNRVKTHGDPLPFVVETFETPGGMKKRLMKPLS